MKAEYAEDLPAISLKFWLYPVSLFFYFSASSCVWVAALA